jgi:hypothetical protein
MSTPNDEVSGIRALAATVLPGDGRFPSAADLAVAERILARLEHSPADAAVFAGLLAATATGSTPEAALSELGLSDAAALRRALQCIYAAYYEDPAVRAVLEAHHGYPDRPPQPLGYAPYPGREQLARLEERRTETLETAAWWSARFDELGV